MAKRSRARAFYAQSVRQAYKRRAVTGAARGYLRTGGLYGRYGASVAVRGRRATAEYKFFDTTKATTTATTAGVIFDDSLNEIPQGVTESTRVSRKCVIKSLSMRGNYDILSATSANQTSDVLRIIVYMDKQTNGQTAAVSDILETAKYNSFRNLSNSGRFKVLMDKSYGISALSGQGDGTTFAFGEVARAWNFHKRCNIPIEFSDTSGAIGTIRSNNIGVLAISKAGAVKFDYIARVRFSDS